MNDGIKNNPSWYPNFYETTGVAGSQATINDMALYWMCTTIPNDNCGGLQKPCGRGCPGDTNAPTQAPASAPSPNTNTGGSPTAFGMNIYATDKNFNIAMVEDMIVNKGVYHFRTFKSWGRTSAVLNMLNQYSSLGTSLLLNIEWSESCSDFVSLFNGYSFDIAVQIDSCGWPDCSNPTEGGFCQGSTMKSSVSSYVSKLNTCNNVLSTNIEFVLPWQDANAHSDCDYQSVLQAARTIQQSNGRKFSLSGTFYNFFHGPNLGAGVFPSSNIDSTANTVQTEANTMANGLTLGLRLAETGWPDQCDNGANKGFGAASVTAMCTYYNQAMDYVPSGSLNTDVKIFWWIIDDRDVGDGCGDGAWGLYDASGNFKCDDNNSGTPSSSCGNIPSTCTSEIDWALSGM